MKNRIVIILMSVVAVALFSAFMLVTKVSDIQTDVAELRINNNDGETQETILDIVEPAFIDTINSVVTDKIYYRQPYINIYNLSEIDYEITLFGNNKKGESVVYKILLNDNVNENTSLGNKSRIDVIKYKSGVPNLKKSNSLKLTTEQETKLIEAVLKYKP